MKKFFLFFLFIGFGLSSIAQSSSTIQGQVRYGNADTTVLAFAKVQLLNGLNVLIDSVFSDNSGNFSFTNLPNGDYKVTSHPIHPWGGVNSTDALVALKYFVHLTNLNGLTLVAGDVDGYLSINAIDAYYIQRRFSGNISSFPLGDWVSDTVVITISSSGTFSRNIKALCLGDVNTSYLPLNNGLPCPGVQSISYGGQTYHTVQIGNQCWLRENLNIGDFVAGGVAQSNNGIIEKYCYSDDTNNCKIYGGLYQWDEMMQYVTTNGAQGICPSGWHIPTNDEYSTFAATLGGHSVAGDKIREPGTAHWEAPNSGATNSSGFTALGSGRRYNGFHFGGIKVYLDLWCSTSYNSANARNFFLYGYEHSTYQGYAPKIDGFSVRCIKNSQ